MSVKDTISIISGIATAAALFVLAWQTIILNEQSIKNDRAWLAITGFQEFGDNHVLFTYSNFGKIPNIKGSYTIISGPNIVNRDDLYKIKNENMELGTILPTQEKSLYLSQVPSEYLKNAKTGGSPFFIAILLKYNYAGGEGEYGMIVKYSSELKDFIIQDSWAS